MVIHLYRGEGICGSSLSAKLKSSNCYLQLSRSDHVTHDVI